MLEVVVVVDVEEAIESGMLMSLDDCSNDDVRLIGLQVSQQRRALHWTQSQLAQAAGIGAVDVNLLEAGIEFDTFLEVACKAMEALDRMETLRAGKAHLRIVQ